MAHARQQIRDAVASLLTGLTTTSSRVYKNRVHKLEESKLPLLLISTDDEAVEVVTISGSPIMERSLTITVRGVAEATSNLDATLDTIIAECETALENQMLGGLVESLILQSIGVDLDGNGAKPVGVATMNFRAVYYTLAAAPGTSI